jgi:predicted nuclease of predicted toxin-antitoxin system
VRFLVDAQLPPRLTEWLRTAGFEAQHLHEIGLLEADDTQVRHAALESGAVLLTKDSDFVVAIARKGMRIVWLRFGNLSNREMFRRWPELWLDILNRLQSGEDVVEVR